MIELRPDLEEAVDRVLRQLEAGAGIRVASEIEALLKKAPEHHLTNYAMGVYRAKALEDPRGAIPFFEKAVKVFPPFKEAHFNLGMAARKVMNIPKAVSAYRKAMSLAENDRDVADLARQELQFLERALLETTTFKTLDAYVANARLFDQAFQHLTDKQFAQAAELFQQVLSENPDHVQSYGNLGLAFAGLGRREAALASLDRAMELDPDYEPAISNRRIVAQMREGEPFRPEAMAETHYYLEKLNQSPPP